MLAVGAVALPWSWPQTATRVGLYNCVKSPSRAHFVKISSDTQRYKDGAHSATPPFSVLGVAAEQYMSHDRRARCNSLCTEIKIAGLPQLINLYADNTMQG